MKAKIIGFKGSRRDTYNNCCILEVEDKNPPGLIGKKVFWKTTSGRAIQGKILHTHGKTALLARFRKGIPGFAIGDELEFKAPALPRPKKVAKKVEKPKVEVKRPKAPEKKKTVPKEKAKVAKPAKKKPPAKIPAKKPEEKKKAKKKPAPKKRAPATKKPAKRAAK